MSLATLAPPATVFDEGPGILSMLTRDEKALYFETARSAYGGRGDVYELGPWLGSGTYQICRGLQAGGHDAGVTVVDRFVWSQLYAERYPQAGLEAGDSFQPVFERNLRAHAGRLQAVRCELQELAVRLPVACPVELLFIDAPKTWRMLRLVLQHFGPHLLPGARVVLQDFFHITSRQLIWLLMALPAFELADVVQSGTAAAFRLKEPLADLDTAVAPSLDEIDTAGLLALWERARQVLPAARIGEVAAGLALDLIERAAYAEARAVLDAHLRGQPGEAAVRAEVARLARYSDGDVQRNLHAVNAWLGAGYAPENLAQTPAMRWTAVFRGGADAQRIATAPSSAQAFTARHYLSNPGASAQAAPRLLGIHAAVLELEPHAGDSELAQAAQGLDVVDLDCGVTLQGPILRALGVARYTGVDARIAPGQRSWYSADGRTKLRTKFPVEALVEAVGHLAYVADPAGLPDTSADLVVCRPEPTLAALDRHLAEARRLLRPGGKVWLVLRNPRTWSGHGKRPQQLADYDKADPAQHKVADWRHLQQLPADLLPLQDVLAFVRRHVEVERFAQTWDEPELAVRITPRVRQNHPGLDIADFTVRETVLAGNLI